MVGPDGNAPSSLAYRASALLLSYEPVAESGGFAPQPAIAGPSVFEIAPAPRRVHSPKWRRAVDLPHRPCDPSRLPTGRRAPRLYSPKWRRREVMLPSGGAARSASNGCRHLGRFDSLRSPLRGRPAVDPSPLRSVASRSPPGRSCTCVDPLRRRRPELLGHGEWTSRRDSHPQPGVRSAA